MKQNESLNNTCILFDKDNEAQQKAIIKFYNEKGYPITECLDRWNKDKYIGVLNGYLGYWCKTYRTMRIIDLPKEYYHIDTPIVELTEDYLKQFDVKMDSENKALEERFNSDVFIDNICLSYDHSFGFKAEQDKQALRFQCKEWMRAISNNWNHFKVNNYK